MDEWIPSAWCISVHLVFFFSFPSASYTTSKFIVWREIIIIFLFATLIISNSFFHLLNRHQMGRTSNLYSVTHNQCQLEGSDLIMSRIHQGMALAFYRQFLLPSGQGSTPLAKFAWTQSAALTFFCTAAVFLTWHIVRSDSYIATDAILSRMVKAFCWVQQLFFR